jgi:hypothetical protein
MNSKLVAFFVGTAALSIPLIHGAHAENQAFKKDNIHDAKQCISRGQPDSPIKGVSKICDRVNASSLPEELKAPFQKAYDINEVKKAEAAKKAEEDRERTARIRAKAAADRLAKDRAEEAAFKAEGWHEQVPGIFIRWCTDSNPCPHTNSYTDYTWRAMVWCKERACGDIYARMNILSNGAVVGWTNETAYGDVNQKVVLTFGSYTPGSGRIVEFNARG